jgi:hypothetical protein
MDRQMMFARLSRFVVRPLLAASLCGLLAACATPRKPQTIQSQLRRDALPPAPPPGEPADLAGLRSVQLQVVFGAPALVRKDAGAEMWRYDGAACKAFFFLYPYGDALLVRHVETLPRGREMAADQACLDTLRPRPPAPVSSAAWVFSG